MPLPIDFTRLAPQDVLDLATFIEREAQQRYELFADHLARRGESEAAEFFRHMAELEGAHGDRLARRRGSDHPGLPAHLRDVAEWDVEGPNLDHDVVALSVPAAIDMAIASEIRARDFFAAAMEHFVGTGVAEVLAELHRDEIGHIRLLEDRRAGFDSGRRRAGSGTDGPAPSTAA